MPTPPAVRIIVWTWLILALAAGQLGWLARLPGPAGPGISLLLSAALVVCYLKLENFKGWIDRLDLRALVLLHVTRFVGIYFLIAYGRGELPYQFAVPGGWGDITVATLALVVCLLPLKPAARLHAITIWNVVGLIDILLVVSTAARLAFEDPRQMRALTTLPLSLLPTFLVPLIIATHVMLFLRLRRLNPPP